MQKVRRTLADYDVLPERTKADFIEGELVMAPAPTPWHERLLTRLVRRLAEAVGSDWDDRVFVSRFEIRALGEAAQPDLVVLPEGTKASGPDWRPPLPVFVAEILSPSTASHDRGRKVRFYRRAGVREAWILDPTTRTIEVHDFASGRQRVLAGGEVAESRAVPGLRVEVAEFFAV
jgi:Uma2 family endonuclease